MIDPADRILIEKPSLVRFRFVACPRLRAGLFGQTSVLMNRYDDGPPPAPTCARQRLSSHASSRFSAKLYSYYVGFFVPRSSRFFARGEGGTLAA